jgi:hypothetical protein
MANWVDDVAMVVSSEDLRDNGIAGVIAVDGAAGVIAVDVIVGVIEVDDARDIAVDDDVEDIDLAGIHFHLQQGYFGDFSNISQVVGTFRSIQLLKSYVGQKVLGEKSNHLRQSMLLLKINKHLTMFNIFIHKRADHWHKFYSESCYILKYLSKVLI